MYERVKVGDTHKAAKSLVACHTGIAAMAKTVERFSQSKPDSHRRPLQRTVSSVVLTCFDRLVT